LGDRHGARIVGRGGFLQGLDQARAGIGEIFLGDPDCCEGILELGAVCSASGPGLRRVDHVPPSVGTRTRPREKLIDPN
jgi:hypothetical protein